MTTTRPTTALSAFQNEIYLRGLAGEVPAYPAVPAELERAAYEAMSPEAVGYVAGGAGGESTVRANRAAFDRWRIVPRMLSGVHERQLETTLLGTTMPAPVLLAPVGVQQIIHPDGERASARAAAGLGVPWVFSTASSTAMEEVTAAADDVAAGAPRWYQLYWPRDRDVAASLVARAEAAGFGAIVLTLDTSMLGWRPRDLDRAYLPFLRGVGIQNYTSDPVFRSKVTVHEGMDEATAQILYWSSIFGDPTLTWDDIAWLRARTRLPIVLKGICSAADATRALEAGVDGIEVSNHGGRQVDGAVAALDALPKVAEVVAGRVPVLFDSGIRTGSDAVKALALGADAVLLGRLFTWGLALGGEDGVRHVLRSFLADLDATLALSGHATATELNADCLEPAP